MGLAESISLTGQFPQNPEYRPVNSLFMRLPTLEYLLFNYKCYNEGSW